MGGFAHQTEVMRGVFPMRSGSSIKRTAPSYNFGPDIATKLQEELKPLINETLRLDNRFLFKRSWYGVTFSESSEDLTISVFIRNNPAVYLEVDTIQRSSSQRFTMPS